MFLSVQSVFRPTSADILTRISTTTSGAEANESSSSPHFSPDGRFVVFESSATNLIVGDTRDDRDIFLKDLSIGTVTRISTTSNGAQANNDSLNPQFSPDGCFVVFESMATNLVDGDDSNRSTDIFLKNLVTGAITRLSTPVGAVEVPQFGRQFDSSDARFSPDGHYVVFASRAPSLVTGDTNNTINDIFLKDLTTGAVTRLSTAANGNAANDDSFNPQFSPDGHFMVFESSASNLDGDGTSTTDRDSRDIFLKNLTTGAVTRLSNGSGGTETNGDSSNPQFSSDGRYVVFQSRASNLVGGDTNGQTDIFLKDLSTGAVTRLSTSVMGVEADDFSAEAQFSLDGRYVTFGSFASNLIAGDMNDAFDIFRIDLFYKEHAAAIAEGCFLETTLAVGNASSASIAWGDGTSSVVTPTAGRAVFNHAYASTGPKAATVTIVEGALTWNVAHTIDVGTGTMVRNTALADTLSGSAGHDTLTGDAFRNFLNGAGGNDRLDGGAGADTMDGGTGADIMDGGADADTMNGGADADVVNGGGGDDRLSGGPGQDRLTGGAGRDVFAFANRETSSSKAKADIILDVSRREGDKIDLSAIDANTRKRGDQKFSFIGKKDFSKAGEARFEKTKSATYLYLNTDNDKAAEAVIKLKGSLELSKGWFVL